MFSGFMYFFISISSLFSRAYLQHLIHHNVFECRQNCIPEYIIILIIVVLSAVVAEAATN